MANVEITITGVEDLQRKLEKLAGGKALEQATRDAAQVLVNDMRQYPAPPAKSRYIRTGNLGKRWTAKVTVSGDTALATIGNDVPYAPYVQSERQQARVHRGRWQTDEQVSKQDEGKVTAIYQAAIDKAAGEV